MGASVLVAVEDLMIVGDIRVEVLLTDLVGVKRADSAGKIISREQR